MKSHRRILFALLGFLDVRIGCACIWDSDTLLNERLHNPQLAQVILGGPPPPPDRGRLLKRIDSLKGNRRENDPAWWNDLAGAYLRLAEAKIAAELLEPVVQRFPNDYGIHANLGTAYHLLARYKDAEREIARDLEINPDAHFGLEKYHLALLQYLSRDSKYKLRHVYVDEFSQSFLLDGVFIHGRDFPAFRKDHISPDELKEWEDDYEEAAKTNNVKAMVSALSMLSLNDPPPAYQTNWNLATDPQLSQGVIYMGSLNPREASCFVMLGVVALKQGHKNLAAAAFAKATDLGSLQAAFLKEKVLTIREHVRKARSYYWQTVSMVAIPVGLISILVIYYLVSLKRKGKKLGGTC